MILEILGVLTLILNITIIVLLVKGDSETSALEKSVYKKGLKLKDKALDIQMQNTESFISQAIQPPEDPPEDKGEDRTPVGFKR